jgi:hypothetical protein
MDAAKSDRAQLRLIRVQHVMACGRDRWWLGSKLSSSLTKDELERLVVGAGKVG